MIQILTRKSTEEAKSIVLLHLRKKKKSHLFKVNHAQTKKKLTSNQPHLYFP